MENGGDGPNNEYHWKQTDDEVTVTVPLDRAYRARELSITIDSNHLTVCIKGKPPIIDGALSAQVNKSLSTWWIDGDTVEFLLHKVLKGNWKSLIPGHPEVDLDLLEGSKYLDDSLLKKIQAQKAQKKAEDAAAAAAATAATAAGESSSSTTSTEVATSESAAADVPPLEDHASS